MSSSTHESSWDTSNYAPTPNSQTANNSQLEAKQSAAAYHLANAEQEERAARARVYEPESSDGVMDGGVLVGLLAMLAAVVWFFAGLAAGYIFFYPPVLFVFGLIGVVRGLTD